MHSHSVRGACGVRGGFAALLFLAFGTVYAQAPGGTLVAPAGIEYAERGYGWLLTDASGMTLYHYAFDQTSGQSACNDECAESWPPLLVLDAETTPPSSEWTHVEREDGTLQWAYRDKPLYTYVEDVNPGNTFGDGYLRQWTLAQRFLPAPRGVDVIRTELGYVLTDVDGKVLYHSTDESADAFACDAKCARTWRPLAAPLLATTDIQYWTPVRRPDGTRQWAFRDRPVYTFTGDLLAGDTRGHELDTWRAVVVEPRPEDPAWVRVHFSDGNMRVLADHQGRTLYIRNAARLRGYALAAARPCDPDCPDSHWEPVLMGADDQPPEPGDEHWSIHTDDDGSQQWAYNGVPVYVNRRDGRMPGLLNGIRGGDRSWIALTYTGEPMQGTGN